MCKSTHANSGLNLKLNMNTPDHNKQNKVNALSTTFSTKNPYRMNLHGRNDHADKNKEIDRKDTVKTIENMNDNVE